MILFVCCKSVPTETVSVPIDTQNNPDCEKTAGKTAVTENTTVIETQKINSDNLPSSLPVTLPTSLADELELTFCGDIMAHTVNYSMTNYDRIYDDIRPLLINDDITFGNFETPVDDNLPMSAYPRFNVHMTYLESAIRGGFDALSLANNHSNDQGLDGIKATVLVTQSMKDTASFSGLRNNETDAMVPQIIRRKGWTILFLSVTEILNSYDKAGKLVYYVSPKHKEREAFLQEIRKFRKENPCDLFVLSIHLNETEYGRVVSEEKKEWFKQLCEAGVDVVWGHHPHVMQGWEQATVTGRPVLYLYSMGNFISGQRKTPDISAPDAFREYTGDGVIMKVRLVRVANDSTDSVNAGKIVMHVVPVPVTNYTDPDGDVLVKLFSRSFIDGLSPILHNYYLKRYSLMYAYLPLLPVEPVTGILQ